MENNRLKYLFKNTAVFAIANFASKLITFFLIPLYTHTLTPDQYGIVDLLFTLVSVLVPLITLNIVESIMRFSLDKDSNTNKIMSIGIVIAIISSILALIFIPILNIFKEYKEYSWYFYFYVITLGVSQIFLYNLKGQEKLKLFSIGNVLQTFCVAILNLYFLVYLRLEIKGYFLAYIISNIIVGIYSFISGNVLKNLKNFIFDKKLFKEMTKYSFYLIPNSFMWWIMNASDRVMVSIFVGIKENGLYGVSYKIPGLLTTLSTIFNQAWIFSAINEKDNKDKDVYTNKVFNNLVFIVSFVSVGILIILKLLFKILFEKEYYIAWQYVPILLVGFTFLTLATFLSTSYNVYKDSKGFLCSGTIGAIVNILLNFLLIPKIGVFGAAIATTFSYLGVFIYRIFDTRKYVKIILNKKIVFNLLLVLSSSIIVYIDNYLSYLLQGIVIVCLIFINIEKIKKICINIKKCLYKICSC